MRSPQPAPPDQYTGSIQFGEFVALMAAIMALTAFAIDTMLPALPAIAHTYGLAQPNQAQWVIGSLMLGNAVGQLLYGPLSDRFGRRRILLIALAAYTVFDVGAGLSATFTGMVVMRFLLGCATASSRVLGVAIIRDQYSGARMARIMSLTFIVFLMVPMLAPALGQAILSVAPWRFIFHLLGALSLGVLVWTAVRLPETLHPRNRRPLSFQALVHASSMILRNRISLGYTLANTFLLGALLGFLNSIQQISFDVFRDPQHFPYLFACAAGMMAVTALANSRIVEQIGLRRVSHATLLVLLGLSVAHWLLARWGMDAEVPFTLIQSLQMGCLTMVMGNFNALGMEPLGALAGSAASLQGFITTLGGTLIGALIGQCFDHTTMPLILGFLACTLAALAAILTTESGRLFGIPGRQPA